MSKFEMINTPEAPEAIGPYSQAMETEGGRTAYLSGQIALVPGTGALVEGDVAAQTRQVLANLDAVLVAAGMSRWNVVKTTIYLVDLGDFPTVNDVYAGHFADHRPARATVQVSALPKSALVEIDAIAVD